MNSKYIVKTSNILMLTNLFTQIYLLRKREIFYKFPASEQVRGVVTPRSNIYDGTLRKDN